MDTRTLTEFGPEGQLRAALAGEPGNEFVSVARGPRLISPDLLVYWAPGKGAPGDHEGSGMVLLGPLGDPGVHRYQLPAFRESGSLVISSLPYESPVASTSIDTLVRIE